ncbi:hypothetical protein [Aestuariivirga sp.]|uniref:hypothetical protein n=1 Tax=Aestuariivirga sp. TaxID=2650926 RepID=UPI00391D0700
MERAVEEDAGRLRDRVLTLLAAGGSLLLVAALIFRAWTEEGGTNSYALVAESLLTQTPWASACFDGDCALRDGLPYVVFPPFPGFLAIPLVLAGGTGQAGFVAISALLYAGSLLLWNGIFRHFGLDSACRAWALAAVGLASPLYYVSLRGDGVWFFAQSTAFFCLALALHQVLIRRNLVLAGVALGAAMLSRQMSVFYLPLLFLIFLREEPLFRITPERLKAAASLCAAPAFALLLYFAYNHWRFGDPLDTGYDYIFAGGETNSMLGKRVAEHGLWSAAYVPFNLFYTFLQGFHAEFADPARLDLTGLDPAGSSLLAASPWLLLMFFAPARRLTFAAVAMAASFTLMMLFYHSNGFSQYNTQRYALDWLPAALCVAGPLVTPERLPWVRLLVTWGILLNVATVAVLGLTQAS